MIERPAAAVKELVENALDAGARAIEVAIEAGGRGLIRVTDDGAAWTPPISRSPSSATRPRSFPTATSRAIATLGFRGEALPSIASVSRLEIRTRARARRRRLRLVVEDGAKSAIEPCAGAAARGSRRATCSPRRRRG